MPQVRDMRAILYVAEDERFSWTLPEQRGTPVIITYSFDTKLPEVGFSIPGESYKTFTRDQQADFRLVLDAYEAVSGVVFVEVDGPAMLTPNRVANIQGAPNAYGATPLTLENFSQSVVLGIGTHRGPDFSPGTRDFRLLLHEVGHTLGLQHAHEGKFTLAPDLDNLSTTVMTYNLPGGASRTNVPGSLDVKATQHLYGKPVDHDDWIFRQQGDLMKITLGDKRDIIIGTNSDTHISGLDGNDRLFGRHHSDSLFGGRGNDELDGGLGQDKLYGGKGADELFGRDGDLVFGGVGDDAMTAAKDIFSASFYGGEGSDRFVGGAGDFGTINAYGGTSSDRLLGRDGTQMLYGDGGKDVLKGGHGADTLFGGGGDDTVAGEVGADVIYGGGGDDLLLGIGAADIIYGGKGRDDVQGGGGNDRAEGGQSNDRMTGAGGNDTLTGGTGKDMLFGGKGADTLFGGGGSDSLYGGTGRDELYTGAGDDVLSGGGGPDTFIIDNGRNRIVDFQLGKDSLELNGSALGLSTFDPDVLFAEVADVKNGKSVLVFGANDRLVLDDVTNLTALAASTDIF